jgi:hypothetical protein
MWRNAALSLPHMAGCTCMRPQLSLDRDAIEADLVACLAQTYRDAGRATLAGFVAARAEAGDPKSSFAAWLAALEGAPLDEPDRRQLIADLAAALASLQAANSAGGFACA